VAEKPHDAVVKFDHIEFTAVMTVTRFPLR